MSSLARDIGAAVRHVRRRVNGPLILGIVMVTLVMVVAVAGPQLAPADPLAETKVLEVGGTWMTPPFPAFKVPGFPLGSDAFGRDLYSRLLWAVGPTMTMVVTVATVRLVLGVIVGLVSGWSEGRVAHALTSLTAAALSVPTLIVALVAIAAIGVEWGIWAFIIGLSVTGWAESAQSIREKARELRGEQFIAASRALGASQGQILISHTLRHVMPMVWMLMAFEIGNTLTVTAALGFLGYFIGGDVWIEVSDFVARRVSGAPELGQMLATSQANILQPWAMFAVGTVIFITVLGFNLLGEGLRRRLALAQGAKRTFYGLLVSDVLPWLDATVVRPSRTGARRHPVLAGALAFIVVAAPLGLVAWHTLKGPSGEAALETTDQAWASDWHDAYGTMHTDAIGPQDPHVLWLYTSPDGLSGGPAVSADGTLYLSGRGGSLTSLSSSGELLWTTALVTSTVGGPALVGRAGNAADVSIYVADVEGGVTSASAEGEVQWRQVPETQRVATSGPIVGPDGTIYIGYGSNFRAIAPDGTQIWTTEMHYGMYDLPPQLSWNGEWVFRQDQIVEAATGDVVDWASTEGVDAYITGEDRRTYARSGNLVMTLSETSGGDIEVAGTTRWDSGAFTFIRPRYAGVTRDEVMWLGYVSYRNGIFVWLSPDGRVYNQAQTPPLQGGALIGLDSDKTAYFCGTLRDGMDRCYALTMAGPDSLWELDLGRDMVIAGGAVVEGRLYVATLDGTLFALGDE